MPFRFWFFPEHPLFCGFYRLPCGFSSSSSRAEPFSVFWKFSLHFNVTLSSLNGFCKLLTMFRIKLIPGSSSSKAREDLFNIYLQKMCVVLFYLGLIFFLLLLFFEEIGIANSDISYWKRGYDRFSNRILRGQTYTFCLNCSSQYWSSVDNAGFCIFRYSQFSTKS